MTHWIYVGDDDPISGAEVVEERIFDSALFDPNAAPHNDMSYPDSEELTLLLIGATLNNPHTMSDDAFARKMLARHGIDADVQLPPARAAIDPLKVSEPIAAHWLGSSTPTTTGPSVEEILGGIEATIGFPYCTDLPTTPIPAPLPPAPALRGWDHA